MTAAGSIHATSCTWRGLLPADRTFIALPSRTHPVVVADHDAAVLRYVRESLLATPPRSRIPESLFEIVRTVLRVRGAWVLAPRLHPRAQTARAPSELRLAEWLAGAGHRTVVLDHSRDGDGSFILLLFAPGASEPSIALKVPTCAASATRVERERDRLQQLQGAPLDGLRATMPQLLEIGDGLPALVTSAQPGVPMLVSYYRNGHSRQRAAVHADFAAAGAWLAALQSESTGAPLRLDVAQSTIEAAESQLARGPGDLRMVPRLLVELRARLRVHVVTPTVVHGDFWAGNILTSAGAVSGVVDWERASTTGSPVRDLARFAVTYSLYLDRHTRTGRRVAGHPGLRAGAPGGGVGYLLTGDSWYPRLVRTFLAAGLRRLNLPGDLAVVALLAELAAIAAEATDPEFGRAHWRLFRELSGSLR